MWRRLKNVIKAYKSVNNVITKHRVFYKTNRNNAQSVLHFIEFRLVRRLYVHFYSTLFSECTMKIQNRNCIRCNTSVAPAQGECNSDLQSAGWRASDSHQNASCSQQLLSALVVLWSIHSSVCLPLIDKICRCEIVLPPSHINYVRYIVRSDRLVLVSLFS